MENYPLPAAPVVDLPEPVTADQWSDFQAHLRGLLAALPTQFLLGLLAEACLGPFVEIVQILRELVRRYRRHQHSRRAVDVLEGF